MNRSAERRRWYYQQYMVISTENRSKQPVMTWNTEEKRAQNGSFDMSILNSTARLQRAAAARERYRRIKDTLEDVPPILEQPVPVKLQEPILPAMVPLPPTSCPSAQVKQESPGHRSMVPTTPQKLSCIQKRRTVKNELKRQCRLENNRILAIPADKRTPEEQAIVERILDERRKRKEYLRRRYDNMTEERKREENRKKNATKKLGRQRRAERREDPSSSQTSNYSDDEENHDEYLG